MLASSKSRSSDSCWTCKLRRKKCDELQPSCANCDSLEITCKYGPKPDWMDGGKQQGRMTELLKSKIKQSATVRREKASIARKSDMPDTAFHQFGVSSDTRSFDQFSRNEAMDSTITDLQEQVLNNNSTNSHAFTSFTLLDYEHQQHNCSGSSELSSKFETDFIMKYLDVVFPALFPFYRPALFETGRTWLLLLLKHSKVAYHCTLSLSSYFFTTALTDAFSPDIYGNCQQQQWIELEKQTNQCFEGIRTDMLKLGQDSQGARASTLERVYILESIVQVLIFETALGRSADWKAHLAPAFSIFEGIISRSGQHAQNQQHPSFTTILLDLGTPNWSKTETNQHIWSPDQAGFRFSAGLLIFIDIIASTATLEPPTLLPYHKIVLAKNDEGTPVLGEAMVRLSTIVGCENWIVEIIAHMNALAVEKREQMAASIPSRANLLIHARSIRDELEMGIQDMEDRSLCCYPQWQSTQHMPWDTHADPTTSRTANLIWTRAVRIYVATVVSGWQFSHDRIRADVYRILQLLQSMPLYQLRGLAWPICIAGCLALESEEAFFRALFEKQGRALMAGSLGEVCKIMEKVWLIRETLEPDTWDLASCLNILGHPVLLI